MPLNEHRYERAEKGQDRGVGMQKTKNGKIVGITRYKHLSNDAQRADDVRIQVRQA